MLSPSVLLPTYCAALLALLAAPAGAAEAPPAARAAVSEPAAASRPPPPKASKVVPDKAPEKPVEPDVGAKDDPAEDDIEVETTDLPDEAEDELDAADAAEGAGGDTDGAAPGDAPAPPEGVDEVDVPESERERENVQFDDFYAGLSPYGSWLETREHGWVWVPYRQSEVEDWRPYMYGQWVWTRHGWTWVSEEDFGWATYHYGRWTFEDGIGWAWLPGYTWGPAWVVWRYGDEAVGWAPLYPGYVVYSTDYPFYWNHWVFVGPGFFYAYPIHSHCWHDHDRIYYHYHHTRWAQHWHYHDHSRVYSGPRRSYVARTGGRPVRTSTIETSSRPARSGLSGGSSTGGPAKVTMYRPDAAGAVRPTGAGTPRTAVPAGASAPIRRPPVGSGLERRSPPDSVGRPGSPAPSRGLPGRGTATPRSSGADRYGSPPSRDSGGSAGTGRAPSYDRGTSRPRVSSPPRDGGTRSGPSYRPGSSGGGSRPGTSGSGYRPRPPSGSSVRGGKAPAVPAPAVPQNSPSKKGKKGKKK